MGISLFFVEDRRHASWIKAHVNVDNDVRLVAITAEAMLALHELDLSHTPIYKLADTRLLAAAEPHYSVDCLNLLMDVESFILERYPSARQMGAGFLTGQAYYVQISIGGIAARAFLMREAIRALSPSSVTVFQGDVDAWFASDGYVRNPWIETLAAICAESGIQVQTIVLPKSAPDTSSARIKNAFFHIRSFLIQLAKVTLDYLRMRRPRAHNNHGKNPFRLLFAHAHLYDWSPVLNALKREDDFFLYYLKSNTSKDVPWGHHYVSVLYGSFFWNRKALNCEPLRYEKKEEEQLSSLLDEWVSTHPQQARMNVLDIEVFPALLPHLHAVLSLSMPVARYAVDLADAVLDKAQPDAVCFSAMPWLSAKVLAARAQERGIPIISYQHGGSYGVQKVPTHDFSEFSHADFFLTYGIGVLPPENPMMPTQAQFVPVGSARIRKMLNKKHLLIQKTRRSLNVLWIAEVSLGNTICSSWLVEDTVRYEIQTKGLRILGNAAQLKTMYRAFPGHLQAQATPDWIKQAGVPSVKIDSFVSLTDSILASDVVICDSSSSTTWNEVLALGKPLILYCDPKQTILMDHFVEDLEKACYWCKSVPELLDVIQRLAKEPKELVNELRQKPRDEYLRKYVLHEGNSVEHVISFLSKVCSEGLKRD